MKKFILLALCLFNVAYADSIQLPNLNKAATGTSLGGGKYGLDINLPPGAVTIDGSKDIGSAATIPGDKGLTTLSVRKDSLGPLTGVADGDYTPLQVNSDGQLKVEASVTSNTSGTPGTPIPAEAGLIGGKDSNGDLQAVSVTTSGEVVIRNLSSSTDTVNSLTQDGLGNQITSTLIGSDQSLDVNVTQSALPSGAATETTLGSIDTKTPSLVSGRVPVDGSGVTQPVSASSLPLPSGAATSAIQTDGTQRTMIVNGSNIPATINQIGSAITSTDQALTTNTVIHGLSSGGGGTYVDVKVNPAGKLLVDADITSSALPTGAATEATLSALNTKIANGTGTATGAVRVVQATGSSTQLNDGTDTALITSAGELATDPATIKATAGSAIPTTGAFILGSDGTNARAIKTNSSGELVVGITQSTPSTSTYVDETVGAVTADSNTAPANCRGFQLFTPAGNTANIRVRYGSTDPTTTIGMQLQPGRSIDYVPACPTIRVISESGTQSYGLAWFTD